MTPSVRLASLFQNTAAFIMKHFVLLLVATGTPLLLSYAVAWLTVGATISQIQKTNSFEELVSLFSLGSALTYTILVTIVVIFCINIIGWVAGPLLMIEQDKLTIRSLFPRAFKYFWPYFSLSIMVVTAVIVFELAIFLVITIILTMIGLIDQASILTIENYLATILPDIGLLCIIVFFMFAPYFLIEEQLTAWQAALKSFRLVQQHFITVLVRFLLLAVMVTILAFVLGFIPFVGGALAYLVAGMVVTVYNYYLYKALTTI